MSDSSYGIWMPTTNNFKNGGAETNKDYCWSDGSISRTTAQFKFGAGSLDASHPTLDGSVIYLSDTAAATTPRLAATAATVYTFSVWLKGNAGGETVRLNLEWYTATSGGSFISRSSSSDVVLTTSMARYTLTATAPGTTNGVWPTVSNRSGTTCRVFGDGFQYEAKPIATPYVETNGATASRGTPRVQGPTSVLGTATQGWVALRIRAGHAATDDPLGGAATSRLFGWADSTTNYLGLGYDPATDKWFMNRTNAGSTASQAISAAQTFSRGDGLTIIGAWTSTLAKVSVNGGAFTTQSNTTIPTLSATSFDIGTGGTVFSGREMNGDVFWAMAGSGTLSDGDAATIHSNGNTDPSSTAGVPGTPLFLWKASTAAWTS